jgi:hypothetical protein
MALSKIAADVSRDKTNPAVKGIIQEIILINWDDLLKANITLNSTTPKSLIDLIALTSGTQGYTVEGFNQVMKVGVEGIFSEEEINGTRHSFTNVHWMDQTAAGKNQLELLREGARFYGIAKRYYQGASQAAAFLFLGYDVGLELTEYTEGSDENDGVPVITIATPPTLKEAHAPRLILETDYATTDARFATGFPTA